MARAEKFCQSHIPVDKKSLIAISYFQRAKTAEHWSRVRNANGAVETSVRYASQGHPTWLNYSYGGKIEFKFKFNQKLFIMYLL
jgi:hypothetical protein